MKKTVVILLLGFFCCSTWTSDSEEDSNSLFSDNYFEKPYKETIGSLEDLQEKLHEALKLYDEGVMPFTNLSQWVIQKYIVEEEIKSTEKTLQELKSKKEAINKEIKKISHVHNNYHKNTLEEVSNLLKLISYQLDLKSQYNQYNKIQSKVSKKTETKKRNNKNDQCAVLTRTMSSQSVNEKNTLYRPRSSDVIPDKSSKQKKIKEIFHNISEALTSSPFISSKNLTSSKSPHKDKRNNNNNKKKKEKEKEKEKKRTKRKFSDSPKNSREDWLVSNNNQGDSEKIDSIGKVQIKSCPDLDISTFKEGDETEENSISKEEKEGSVQESKKTFVDKVTTMIRKSSGNLFFENETWGRKKSSKKNL
jgi:hypothetical protein